MDVGGDGRGVPSRPRDRFGRLRARRRAAGRAARARRLRRGRRRPQRARARPPACAGSSAAPGSPPTASPARGPAARSARQGRHPIGSRPLRRGQRGWDVAALQFALETHGFPCGTVDGGFGARTSGAVRRLQAFAGLTADGVAGPATLRRALTPAGPRPRAAQADRRAARRPLRPARRPVPRRPGLPRPHRHRDHRRRLRPRDLRRLRRRLGPHRRPRPRQRRSTPATPTSRRAAVSVGAVGRRRRAGRPRRLDRLRHRPAPALRGHRPRSQRRPGPRPRPLLGGQTPDNSFGSAPPISMSRGLTPRRSRGCR